VLSGAMHLTSCRSSANSTGRRRQECALAMSERPGQCVDAVPHGSRSAS
jgi:hypothetical protein